MSETVVILVNGEVLANGHGAKISDQRRSAGDLAEALAPLVYLIGKTELYPISVGIGAFVTTFSTYPGRSAATAVLTLLFAGDHFLPRPAPVHARHRRYRS